MSAHLLIDVWHNIADPQDRTRLGRLLQGADLARMQRSLSRVGHDFRTGRDFASAGHDEVHSSTPDAALPEIVADIRSLLSSGDLLPETSTKAITAIATGEGIPVVKERLRRPPTKSLRRLTHRIVHAVHENAKDSTDDTRRALEAVIRPDNQFLGVDRVSGSGALAGGFTQAAIQTGNKLRLQKDVQPSSLAHSKDAPPKDRDQTHQSVLDADQTPLEGDTIEPSSRTIDRIAGLATLGLSVLERRLEISEWEAVIDRDAMDVKRLRIRRLPLVVIDAHAMLVGAQLPKVSAEAMLETAAALSGSEHLPQARCFSL